MLRELTLQNFAVAQDLRLTFSNGFNCITGETGAGKSIAVDALAFALGARVGADVIRAGAPSAYVEAVFEIGDRECAAVDGLLGEAGLALDDGCLLLAREIGQAGRSSARVNGRSIAQPALAELGVLLADIHGQHEHLRILRARDQLLYLDRFGGLAAQREALAHAVDALREVRKQRQEVAEGARVRERRLAQLGYETEEIAAASLQAGEDVLLQADRKRLANAQALGLGAAEALDRLDAAASDPLASAAEALDRVAALDEEAIALRDRAFALQSDVTDLLREVRAYGDLVEGDPERLQAVEERLVLLGTLKRKYGESIEEVLAYAQEAAAEIERLERSEEDAAGLAADEERLAGEVAALAASLSAARKEAATSLATAVSAELAALEMANARFEPSLEPVTSGEEAGGLLVGRSGAEQVEFLVSFNTGEALKPLGKVASGGETSRFMLALKSALGAADDTPLMVFDEVDAGLGGRSGAIVGRQLARLAERCQVICITHLPQVAARAESHWFVAKEEIDGRTRASVHLLEGEPRVEELAQMLGGVSAANLAAARDLLAHTR
jgi:DNA repair protein RecN (Recombination protein N)